MKATSRLTVDELFNKLPLQVLKEEIDSTALHGLLTSSLKVLLLTNIGHERNNIVALLNKPEKDARSVYQSDQRVQQCMMGLLTETTRVSKDDLALLLGGWGHNELQKPIRLSAHVLTGATGRRRK